MNYQIKKIIGFNCEVVNHIYLSIEVTSFLKPTDMKIKKRKKLAYILGFLLIAIIVFRLLLPGIVKNYVNKTLQEIPGYWGKVDDIDIALIRGAYVIHGLQLDRVESGNNIPFLKFEKTDISIQWSALFKGKIVSEITLYKPTVNYVFEEQETANTSTEDWSQALKDLVPIDINKLTVQEGKFSFLQLSKSPDVDLYINQINLQATNLRNVNNPNTKLPSSLHATGVSIGEGTVQLDGKMNLVQQIPDLDLNFSLKKASATALNTFTLAYAGIDFEEGNFELYSELAINDGYMKGYFKPIFTNLKILDSFKKENSSIFKKMWEGFVGLFKFLFKNHKQDSLATIVKVEGDLNEVKSSIWTTIGGIFKNAFIKAYKPVVDEDIEFSDATADKK